jgi:hypothetical protein
MKTKTLAIMVGATIGVWAVAPVWAQTKPADTKAATNQADVDKMIELVRKDVRADKADIVSKTMKLDASQAAAFWPVYKAYEAERQALGDQRLFVIQDLAEHFETLNDAKAKGLLDRSLAIEEQRVALERKYEGEFLKVLPAKTVARFFQVDSRLNNLINLQVSSQIPLVN